MYGNAVFNTRFWVYFQSADDLRIFFSSRLLTKTWRYCKNNNIPITKEYFPERKMEKIPLKILKLFYLNFKKNDNKRIRQEIQT